MSTDFKKNVYAFNRLKSSSLNLNPESSYLLARLIDIESKLAAKEIPLVDFANAIFSAFNKSGESFSIDRVCLAYITPYSPKLIVVSSYNSPNIGANNMEPGYNCFVAGNSSLFTIDTSNVRICSDLDATVSSYQEAKKPVQKSLSKLHKMGIKSGLTLGIDVDGFGQGFLFLNSCQKGKFDEFQSHDYFIACLLKLLGRSALHYFCKSTFQVSSKMEKYLKNDSDLGSIFHPKEFTSDLHDILQEETNKEVALSFQSEIKENFFFPTGAALYLVSNILDRCYDISPNASLRVEIIKTQSGTDISLKISSSKMEKKARHEDFVSLAATIGFKTTIADDYFELISPFEPEKSGGLRAAYSTDNG